MKIALAQLNYHIGNFEANTAVIVEHIENAKSRGAELIVFAELAICGYPPRDFLEFHDFIDECDTAMAKVASACVGIAAIVGAPSVNPKVEGKHLYNSAWFLADGVVQSKHHKALLPTYDIFDEYRYFEPSRQIDLLEYKGLKIALTICEDIWDVEEDLMYTIQPMDELMQHQPDLMINIAASPFSYDHAQARKKVLERNVKKYQLPIVYVNHVGAQTELIFDGGSVAMNARAEVVQQLPYFEEGLSLVESSDLINNSSETVAFKSGEKLANIHQALVLGIRDYFRKLGFQKAILGLSGGIDSALTLALAAEALGPENTMGVLLPSQFSSDHSITDSEALVKNLGCLSETLPIHSTYQAFEQGLDPFFKDLPFDVTEENIQARIRGTLLMAFSNKFGYILLNTSNKSEAAVGYGTLYGDMAGGLSVLGDVYKTEVFALARYLNRNGEVIPTNIINKPPSAELRPNQKDSDSLPDYAVLDQVLYRYIEDRMSPQAIIDAGYDEQLVRRILKLVNINEYKRYQTSPVLRVSNKAFGMGRRMPIVARYLS